MGGLGDLAKDFHSDASSAAPPLGMAIGTSFRVAPGAAGDLPRMNSGSLFSEIAERARARTPSADPRNPRQVGILRFFRTTLIADSAGGRGATPGLPPRVALDRRAETDPPQGILGNLLVELRPPGPDARPHDGGISDDVAAVGGPTSGCRWPPAPVRAGATATRIPKNLYGRRE